MMELAAIRPDDWNLPLFLHVLGAFTLVGALVMAASYLFAARRDGSIELMRSGYRSLLLAALPAMIVSRLTAEWIADKEALNEEGVELAWIDIGYISSDLGILALIGATVAAGLAVRRAGRVEASRGSGGVALAAWLSTVLIAVYLVVIWLMATKPD